MVLGVRMLPSRNQSASFQDDSRSIAIPQEHCFGSKRLTYSFVDPLCEILAHGDVVFRREYMTSREVEPFCLFRRRDLGGGRMMQNQKPRHRLDHGLSGAVLEVFEMSLQHDLVSLHGGILFAHTKSVHARRERSLHECR